MKIKPVFVRLIFLATLASGLLNIASVIVRNLPRRIAILREVFPLEFVHLSRSLTLLIGFALVISAVNIYRKKRRAFWIVLVLSVFSVVSHMGKGLNYEEAIVSLLLLVMLLVARSEFVVKSGIPSLSSGVARLLVAALLAFGYGVAGFWFLHPREFGIEFHAADAIRRTLLFLTLAGDPTLVPHTHYARWFLDSLYLITAAAMVYSLVAIFRPAIYRFTIHPRETALARQLVDTYGRDTQDFFKAWPDKSFFFSPSQRSFISYRVGNAFAVALGDPVGPEEEMVETVRGFARFCRENDWGLAFHQASPELLPVYERLGFKKMKIGDDAIVDLASFSLSGRDRRAIRNAINRIEAAGVTFRRHEPPIPDEVMLKVANVSDEWLKLPGRRERQFTLGSFDPAYVRTTPLYTAVDRDGTILAFVNEIPSRVKDEATIDLMRHVENAPNGIMDFLFAKLFLHLKERGLGTFNFGMAPMSGFAEGEKAGVEARVVHSFFQHLNFLFSYNGLRHYKAKFASFWKARYVVYRNPLDLPRMALALREVSRIKPDVPLLKSERFRNIAKQAAAWGIAAVCLVWVFHGIHVGELPRQFKGIRWGWITAAVLMDVLSYVAQGMRWKLLLLPGGRISILKSTQAIYIALFVNEIVPLRVGEFVRAYAVSRWMPAEILSIIPSIAVERLFDGVWLAGGVGITALLVHLPGDILKGADILGIATLAGVALFIFLVLRRRSAGVPENPPGREKLLARAGRLVDRLAGGIRDIGFSKNTLLSFMTSSLVLVFQILSFWLVMKGYGLGLSIFAGAAVLFIEHLGTLIPNAPSNLGTYQFFTVVGLTLFGIDKTTATGFSLVVFTVLTLPLWLIGLAALHGSGLRLKEIRSDMTRMVKQLA
jgi:phosphatidylglycerol lysyltransferase